MTVSTISRNLLFAGILLLAACGGYSSDIDAVKRAQSLTGQTNEELVKEIAGARGTFDWSARDYVAGKDEIILVEARIEKTDNKGSDHVIQLQWIHNRQTGKIASEDVIVDGRARGILQGALDLMLLELE